MDDKPIKATSTKSTFQLKIEIRFDVRADREKIWQLITDAGDIHRWNTTILSVQGTIAWGETIKLKTTLDTSRTFKLKVTTFSPPSEMVWSDGLAPFFAGTRRFVLTEQADGSTGVYRVDVFRGLLFPLVAGALPDLNNFFESFANELKAEAEKQPIS